MLLEIRKTFHSNIGDSSPKRHNSNSICTQQQSFKIHKARFYKTVQKIDKSTIITESFNITISN